MVHRTPSPVIVLAGWLLSVGCSSAGDAAAVTAADAESTDTGDPTLPTNPDALVSGYALSGQLRLGPSADEALLGITTYAGDGTECSEPLLAILEPAEPPEDEPVLAWWSVSIDPTGSVCAVPADLFSHIGVGSYDDRLDVSLVQQGYESATPFGLYLRANEVAPVWVVGVAGTDEQLAGEAPAEPPVVDATYTVASLLQAPWPGVETTALR